MRNNTLNLVQIGFLVLIVPIVLIAFVVGSWNHNYKMGWDFYMKGVDIVFKPLFLSLESAIQIPASTNK